MEKRTGSSLDFASEVRTAHDRIGPDIRRTPLEYSEALSEEVKARVFVKWECDQVTGSFKFRGALHRLRTLTPREKSHGVVSASTGNHGLAIAQAARLEDVDLKLFLPTTVAEEKRKKIEELGVAPEFFGTDCQKTETHARSFASETGRTFISPYNDWGIIFGAGTIGLEIALDLPAADDVLVPVGGGGLIGGIASFLKAENPRARVVGVEPSVSAFMAASIAAGLLVDIEEGETVADAVAGGIEPGSVTFPLCRDFVERILLVPETMIVRAMALIYEAHGRMVEGAGALPLAALLRAPEVFRGRTVALIVSGQNIAPARFKSVIA